MTSLHLSRKAKCLCVALLCWEMVACSSRRQRSSTARDKDTVVPQETQRRAEQNYGQQEAFGNDLGLTTSEQAGAAHERAVDRARDPDRENRKNK